MQILHPVLATDIISVDSNYLKYLCSSICLYDTLSQVKCLSSKVLIVAVTGFNDGKSIEATMIPIARDSGLRSESMDWRCLTNPKILSTCFEMPCCTELKRRLSSSDIFDIFDAVDFESYREFKRVVTLYGFTTTVRTTRRDWSTKAFKIMLLACFCLLINSVCSVPSADSSFMKTNSSPFELHAPSIRIFRKN